jgi:hypothetical protein
LTGRSVECKQLPATYRAPAACRDARPMILKMQDHLEWQISGYRLDFIG